MTQQTVFMTVTAGVLVMELIWQTYARFWKNNSLDKCAKHKNARGKESIYETMFFTNESSECRTHAACKVLLCTKENCAVKYIRRIVEYLNSATSTIDVCMFFFTCEELAHAIGNARNRGVVVRVITDETMSQNQDCQVMYFYALGVRLKLCKQNSLMHHKFAIVDSNILITGSVNWTNTGFFGNFENIIVTNEPALVSPFVAEYEKLWTYLDTSSANSQKHTPKHSTQSKQHAILRHDS